MEVRKSGSKTPMNEDAKRELILLAKTFLVGFPFLILICIIIKHC